MSEQNTSQRQANIGVDITLKGDKVVTVRELSMESIIKITADLAKLLTVMEFGAEIGIGNLTAILARPEIMEALKNVAAHSTKTTAAEWSDRGITDWVKLIKALKQVMDWSEIKELFTELGLIDYFRQRTPANLDKSGEAPESKSQPSELPTPQPS